MPVPLAKNPTTMKQTTHRNKGQMYPLVESWLSSGQSKQQFCTEHQINLHTFTYWVQKYREDKPGGNQPAFIQIVPPATSAAVSLYTLQYPNGVVLHVNSPVSAETLHQLLRLA